MVSQRLPPAACAATQVAAARWPDSAVPVRRLVPGVGGRARGGPSGLAAALARPREPRSRGLEVASPPPLTLSTRAADKCLYALFGWRPDLVVDTHPTTMRKRYGAVVSTVSEGLRADSSHLRGLPLTVKTLPTRALSRTLTSLSAHIGAIRKPRFEPWFRYDAASSGAPFCSSRLGRQKDCPFFLHCLGKKCAP